MSLGWLDNVTDQSRFWDANMDEQISDAVKIFAVLLIQLQSIFRRHQQTCDLFQETRSGVSTEIWIMLTSNLGGENGG